MNKIAILKKMINESKYIVFFGGAGVSTASGLKDFRSSNGLAKTYPVEQLLSKTMFYQNPQQFYQFYKAHFNCLNALPNVIHYYLKDLEQIGKLKAIITQNIDGLHQKAGSQKVYEIHGSIYRNHCLKCHKNYPAETIFNSKDLPLCSCKGLIKPDVTLYEEELPASFANAIEEISKSDMLIVAGTSLNVYPASSLIHYFKGQYLVIINNDITPYDKLADLVINDDLTTVFTQLKK